MFYLCIQRYLAERINCSNYVTESSIAEVIKDRSQTATAAAAGDVNRVCGFVIKKNLSNLSLDGTQFSSMISYAYSFLFPRQNLGRLHTTGRANIVR